MSVPVRVMFIVTGLSRGGAEVMLSTLLRSIDRKIVTPCVVSLKDRGAIGAEIEGLRIPLFALEIGTRRGVLAGLRALLRLMHTHDPDVLQGWLPHGNLVATVAGTLRHIKVVWGVRNSILPAGTERAMTLWWVRALSHLCGFSARIIYNSEAGRRFHESIGYTPKKSQVIFNGFDLQRFVPSGERRARFRSTHGISPDAPVVGLIGRYHPLKDHATFLGAAEIIRQSYPETVFLLVGRDCTPENALLQAAIDGRALKGCVRLLGELAELEAVFPALDILVSSSISEGFPTAVGEAMSCGVPCVVTDVGDSGFLVDRTGLVAPARNPEALATACMRLLAMDPQSRAKLGTAARQRIAQQFSVEQAARQYESMYREITT